MADDVKDELARRIAEQEQRERKARQERATALAKWIVDKWKDPALCPYCGEAAWSIDPEALLLQRLGESLGVGVPVYVIRCENCGNEVMLSAETLGLWPDDWPTP